MPGLVVETRSAVATESGGGIWSRRRDEITFDRLQKFWNELPLQARQELLRIDKQTLFEQVRKNLYCSRCNGLLLESFTQIVMYGKSLQQEGGLGMVALPSAVNACESCREGELDEVQDPAIHPWGGLATTKEGILTLLDCFLNADSLKTLQNVFDNARAREREREMLYPDACGGGIRGWISQGIATYGRGHGTRETCALHTAHLSCDTLVDFWSALGEETRLSLLRMKEEDFIERLMYRFDSKRFCRDCRRNVIREFKELKELKRMRREPRCTAWFCIADTAFQCEVSENAVIVDWHQSFLETDGSYHHFEWAVGTDEGKSDVVEFEDVGMNGNAQKNGLDLGQFDDYHITLRAWKLDGRCSEFSVKAHALKGQSCVHRRLVVGDGFVTITKGESIRSFFEHAEEAEEEDEDAMDRDGNDLDGDSSHPQKHAKSPELAREFLLDAATVIFKEQVEKAFREGTARQNAHSVFVSLALKMLEERVHVACKEIITLEKQTKLLEEEEREKREEEERRERRKAKEREKKLRRKERHKEKEKERKLVETKSCDDSSPTSMTNSSTCLNEDSPNTARSRDSTSDQEDNAVSAEPCSPDVADEQSSTTVISKENVDHLTNLEEEFTSRDWSDSFISEQFKSSRRKPRLRKESPQDEASIWYYDYQDETGCIGDVNMPSRERFLRSNTKYCNAHFNTNSRMRDRYDNHSCSCGHQEDYRVKDNYFASGREMKATRRNVAVVDNKPRLQYRSVKYSNSCYPLDNFGMSKGSRVGGAPVRSAIPKQVWEPMDPRKKGTTGNAVDCFETDVGNVDISKQADCDRDAKGCQGDNRELTSLNEEQTGKCKDVEELKTHPIFAKDEKKEADCQDGSAALVDKLECCRMNGRELEQDTGSLTNFASSGNSSSCLSEGDSSTSSSSIQNPDSSSTSDSEESSDRNNSNTGDSTERTSSGSLLESGIGTRFREYQPKVVHTSNNDGFGVGTAPLQDPVFQHQSSHVAPLTFGFQNHSWAAPVNGYFPFAQPRHFSYATPVGYGVHANHGTEFSMHYNNVPFQAPAFSVAQHPSHRAVPSFNLVNSAAHNTNGDLCRSQQHVGSGVEPMGSRYSLGNRNPARDLPSKPKPVRQNGVADTAANSEDKSAPFSLFHFGFTIAPPDPLSSKDDTIGGFVPKAPQTCSKEETNVKEYNLFSGRNGDLFSFL